MKTIDINDKNSFQNAVQALKKGGILIFPTDTVYGVGCLMKESAIKKLYKIKNRPAAQPTAVLMSRNFFDAKRTKEINLDFDLENKFLFGQLTLVDSIRHYVIDFPAMITADEKIGVRLPNYPWLEKLIDEVGPIVASSANKKGERIPTNFAEISPELINEADLTIQTNDELCGTPSTVYDLEHDKTIRV
jgi:L-threonylcarbamoyladenylate synthase